MSIYGRRISVSLPVVILLLTLSLFIPLLYFSLKLTKKSFFEDEGPFWLFMVGLVPGLFVALLQFVLSWAEFREISKYRKMRIKGMLDSRDLSQYYAEIISTAQTQIDVEGVTASRMMRDFADSASPREEKRILISALQRGVKLRLLLPEKRFLPLADQPSYDFTGSVVDELITRFPGAVHVRYFSHEASNALVRIDDEVIVGPVFSHTRSQHSPAIHTVAGGRFGQSYIANYENVWLNSRVR